MSKPPAFQFYPGDFLVGTMHLTTEETGAYIRLLCIQWDKGEIPDDIEKCARMTGCQAHTIESIWNKFGIYQNGARKNARLEAERVKQTNFRSKQAENISRRWKKNGGNTKPEPDQYGGNTKPEPDQYGGNTKPEPDQYGGNTKPEPSPYPSSSSSSSILPLSSPEGDNEPVSSETEAAEKKEGGRAHAKIASEAGARILAMFAPARQIAPVCFGELLEHVANGELPADEKKWRALEAMRAERAAIDGTPDDIDLRYAWLYSKERLCRDLPEALATALAKRPQGPSARTAEKKDAAPEGWRTRAAALWPHAHIGEWSDLTADMQEECK